jgi:hypothetical protein
MKYHAAPASLVLRLVPDGVEAQRRQRIVAVVRAFWSSVLLGELRELLDPIPLTRLYAAERAFCEVGAVRAAGILRKGVLSLTRSGAPAPLTQVAANLVALLRALDEDVEACVTAYLDGRVRKAGGKPDDGQLGHQVRQSGSALYGDICALCGATDAAGDRRMYRPCPRLPGIPAARPQQRAG